ncbi:hypothetical protein HYY75_06085, partial [bacterium]|nr:hypothetical protein [bacterium]
MIDVSVLARAGLVFNINPDPEVPYRLFEIIESSSGAKVEAVRKILDGACKVIKASRILKNNYSEYLKRLQEWVDTRVARRKVFGYLKKLVEPEIDQTPLEKLVLADIQKKEVRDAFKEALEWQIPEILKNRIKDFLSGEKHQKHSSNKNSLEDFDRISVEEKIRLFVCLGSDEKEKLAPILDRILTDKKAPDNLRAMGLRTALRLEMGNFSDLAFNWVMGSREILIASAIEYLSYFNIDLVIPLLGIHLKSSNPRLRILAINVLKKANPSHAISALIAILRSRDSESRKLAMDCLIQFDFSLLREPLVEFLLSSRGKKFIPEILPLFQANPDPENFFSLYRIEMCLNPAAAKSVKAARLLCEEILVKCGRLTKDKTGQREKDLIERYSFEEEKRRNPQAYAISKLR